MNDDTIDNLIILDDEAEISNVSSLRQKANAAKKFRCRTLLAVLEHPNNPSNIGSVIRNIDGLGISKLYIIGTKSNSKNIKKQIHHSSVGACKYVYCHYFETTKDCHDYLLRHNYSSLATSPHQKSLQNFDLQEHNYQQYKKLAIWFGNETCGLTETAIAGCCGCIQISMGGIVESLNLSVSTAIVLYHVASNRRQYRKNKI